MTTGFDLAHPWALVLLPLALLPLLRRKRETLAFSHLPWLPQDRAGRIAGFLWHAFALLSMLSVVLALAGPGRSETEVPRIGRGAEIVLLMDRSRSMDEHMLPADWQSIDPHLLRGQTEARGQQKGKAARELLSSFVARRPDDRFSIMFFSASPIHAVPFTQHTEVVQAGITAGGIGRGLSNTDVGRALLAAIETFDRRLYSGSRIILLVSDGGARLDPDSRRKIEEGLLRNRITLNWFYLKSIAGPDLETRDLGSENIPEIALHHFFTSLPTPYRAYQAQSPEDLAEAVADVDRQQNFPLEFLERVPRQDYSRHFLAAAAFFCVGLLAYRAVQLRSWS